MLLSCSHICWLRGTGVKPFTVLCVATLKGVRLFNWQTREMTTVPFSSQFDACGIACSPSGHLIVSGYKTHSIYCVHPITGQTSRIAGTGTEGFVNGDALTAAQFNAISCIAIVESERCLAVADACDHCIRKVPLSNDFFAVAGTL